MNLQVGDRVDILLDGKVFMPDQGVKQIGRKYIYVWFGGEESEKYGPRRRFTFDGRGTGWYDRFTIVKRT